MISTLFRFDKEKEKKDAQRKKEKASATMGMEQKTRRKDEFSRKVSAMIEAFFEAVKAEERFL